MFNIGVKLLNKNMLHLQSKIPYFSVLNSRVRFMFVNCECAKIRAFKGLGHNEKSRSILSTN